MLRMAHRIAIEKRVRFEGFGRTSDIELQRFWKYFKSQVTSSTSLIASNVREYVDSCDKRLWEQETDFPGCIPFCNQLFIEWAAPDGPNGSTIQYGVLCLYHELTDMERRDACQARGDLYQDTWSVCDMCLTTFWNGNMTVLGKKGHLRYDSRRQPQRLCVTNICDMQESIDPEVGAMLNDITLVPMLALSFANCKNVVHRDVTASEGPAAKWLRRQKAPVIRYHVLDINPMKEVLRTEGGVETNGLKKALHICRGHFCTYTAEKPLFGTYVGTVWKPAHVRGDIKQGAVVKDYRVNPD